ncbi:antibiotic biosynthesis monooxygenase [Nocardia miyunensis]|uniref:antibiotic biosynthesis monooxygenase n=1 Tax=Nocardia miyunensis TaxID=282684 RepID=UPI0008312BCB|nr:antibiotic biosynthesis monooxygenase [Nocardia miyunensis]
MTTITTDAQLTTLINVFTVQPERQRTLVELLTRATDEVMRHKPGFVSANIHASDDGTRVVNYAQWESADAYREMFSDPTARVHMKEAAAVADHFDPHLFTVESIHHR